MINFSLLSESRLGKLEQASIEFALNLHGKNIIHYIIHHFARSLLSLSQIIQHLLVLLCVTLLSFLFVCLAFAIVFFRPCFFFRLISFFF